MTPHTVALVGVLAVILVGVIALVLAIRSSNRQITRNGCGCPSCMAVRAKWAREQQVLE